MKLCLQGTSLTFPTMAETNERASVFFQEDFKGSKSRLMDGGPVGPISGPYVNGSSTGTNSLASTPRFVSNVPEYRVEVNDIKTTEFSYPRMSPRAGTWPRSPSPSPQSGPAEQLPEAQGTADGKLPTSHPIPSYGPHEGDAGGPRSRAHAKISAYTDDDRAEHQFPRISRPVELLRGSYDCVVIGSGYGGGVAASRMARTGESVCVLERGREKWPGEYPTGSEEAVDELHWSGTFAPGCWTDGMPVDGGDPTGMYHLIFGKGQNAVVCNGEFLAIPG